MVDDVLEPVIEMGQDDRRTNIQLVYKANDLHYRTQKLEEATFKTDLFENPTYIQTIDKRLTDLEIFSKRELQRAFDDQKNKADEIHQRMFIYEQQVKQVMKLQEAVEREQANF